MDLGPYAAFILWAYAGTALLMIGLIAYVAASARAAERRLAALEAQGIRRRSDSAA